jgi:hypothetical protein
VRTGKALLSGCLSHLQQAFGDAIPLFVTPERQGPFAHCQKRHERDQAFRAIFEDFRCILKEKGAYLGSLVEIIDRYEIKIAGVALEPFLIVPKVVVRARRAAPKRPSRAEAHDDSDLGESFSPPDSPMGSDAPAPALRRSSRRQRQKRDADMDYYE